MEKREFFKKIIIITKTLDVIFIGSSLTGIILFKEEHGTLAQNIQKPTLPIWWLKMNLLQPQINTKHSGSNFSSV